METGWNKLDGAAQPELAQIREFVNSSLWNDLCGHLEEAYGVQPKIEYSGCGGAPGWNVKYRKAGRGLCTLYPMPGWFIALVVIGERERTATEQALPLLSPYTQALYANTKMGMGQRWLMIEVRDGPVLEDVKQLVSIRRGAPLRK